MTYDPGRVGPHPDVTRAALAAADATINWQLADTPIETVILAFLEYMSENYVGDYYVEGSLAHLVTMVRELDV